MTVVDKVLVLAHRDELIQVSILVLVDDGRRRLTATS